MAIRITTSDYDMELLDAIEALGDGAFDDVIVRAETRPRLGAADPEWRITFYREVTLRKARTHAELRELVRQQVLAVAARRYGSVAASA